MGLKYQSWHLNTACISFFLKLSSQAMKNLFFFSCLSVFVVVLARPDDDPVLRGSELSLRDISRLLTPKFDLIDPLAGLTSNAPDVLHRNAARLQKIADDTRKSILKQFWPEHSAGNSRIARLLEIGRKAISARELVENRVYVAEWKEWWSKFNKPVPYDTRLDADQFMAYLIQRLHGRLSDTADFLQFEKNLDEKYRDLMHMQKNPCLTDGSDASCTTSEELPTETLHIVLI